MSQWFKEFWHDKAMFERCIKGLIVMVGGVLASGAVPLPEGYFGALMPYIAIALGVAWPAGEKNNGNVKP